MKLSNKILFGFFGFIFLYLTAAFAELRLSGISNDIHDKNSIAETADISGIAYVILNDIDKNIEIIGSDQPRLEVRSFSGDLLKKLTYKFSGDTLTLSGLQSEDTRTLRISVFVPGTTLNGITVNRSVATIEGLQQELLHISQNAGRIWMSGSRIARIQLDVSNKSHLEISRTNLDTVSANIDGSQVFISSPAGLVQGSMKDNSLLHLTDIQEIQLKKDESSRLNMYE